MVRTKKQLKPSFLPLNSVLSPPSNRTGEDYSIQQACLDFSLLQQALGWMPG